MAFDITGFGLTMSQALSTTGIDSDALSELRSTLAECVAEFRALDQWKLRNARAQTMTFGQPCMHRGSPGVVLGTTAVQVTIRVWPRPATTATDPLIGRVRSVTTDHIGKVSTQAVWEAWCRGMARSGHDPTWWATSNFHQAASVGAA
jgi:hypothetical protein